MIIIIEYLALNNYCEFNFSFLCFLLQTNMLEYSKFHNFFPIPFRWILNVKLGQRRDNIYPEFRNYTSNYNIATVFALYYDYTSISRCTWLININWMELEIPGIDAQNSIPNKLINHIKEIFLPFFLHGIFFRLKQKKLYINRTINL